MDDESDATTGDDVPDDATGDDVPDDTTGDGVPGDVTGDGVTDDPPLADPETADEVIEEFVEQRDLGDESWADDGEKVRCPECGAVHEEPQDACRVCGWEPL